MLPSRLECPERRSCHTAAFHNHREFSLAGFAAHPELIFWELVISDGSFRQFNLNLLVPMHDHPVQVDSSAAIRAGVARVRHNGVDVVSFKQFAKVSGMTRLSADIAFHLTPSGVGGLVSG